MTRCPLNGGGLETLTERHVQAMWYDRSMRPPSLYARDGSEVSVIHPGEWNLGPGPDFKDAVLEVGPQRRRLRGDVEIHLGPSDWDAHGHGRDPAYSRVIAHVTWRCGPPPATLPPGALSIWIGRFVASDPGFSPDSIDLSAYPFARLPMDERPCWERLHDNPDLAGEIVAEAGRRRFRAKARRLASVAAMRGGERMQVFYEEIMAALGYRWNTRGFRQVAAMVPYAQMVSEPSVAAAALVSASQFVEWNRTPTRPWNSPGARLASAGLLLAGGALVDSLAGASDFSRRACMDMVRALAAGGHLGKGRAAAIIANVVLPWAVAEGRAHEIPQWLPPEDVSWPVRLTACRMFGRDHNPRVWYSANGVAIQGLIQIHRDFCLQVHPDCGGCALVAGMGAA